MRKRNCYITDAYNIERCTPENPRNVKRSRVVNTHENSRHFDAMTTSSIYITHGKILENTQVKKPHPRYGNMLIEEAWCRRREQSDQNASLFHDGLIGTRPHSKDKHFDPRMSHW
ncbi:hypothetical protein Adt_11899 [Abeliophyllum distichum]|uniref:Uncharacterized protein n=1 Tax=Abeliophyllum distichum TaxID=126358 RepID=A0ABD1UP65_9LAMI